MCVCVFYLSGSGSGSPGLNGCVCVRVRACVRACVTSRYTTEQRSRHAQQFCRSSEPSRQSSSPSHVHAAGMQRSSVGPQRNCAVAEHSAAHVRLSADRTKKSGQAHENWPRPGDSRHRCEQPPLSVPHGFSTAQRQRQIYSGPQGPYRQ